MRNGVRLCYHGTTLPESGRESRPHRTCAAHLRWRDGRRRQGILRACRPRLKGVVCHHGRDADGQSGSGGFAACRTGSTGTTYDAARGGCPPNEGDGPQLAGEPGGEDPDHGCVAGSGEAPAGLRRAGRVDGGIAEKTWPPSIRSSWTPMWHLIIWQTASRSPNMPTGCSPVKRVGVGCQQGQAL